NVEKGRGDAQAPRKRLVGTKRLQVLHQGHIKRIARAVIDEMRPRLGQGRMARVEGGQERLLFHEEFPFQWVCVMRSAVSWQFSGLADGQVADALRASAAM